MKYILLLIALVYSLQTSAREIIKVAVLDTEIDSFDNIQLCSNGYVDKVVDTQEGKSFHWHGRKVAEVITSRLTNYSDHYCIVAFNLSTDKQPINARLIPKALKLVSNMPSISIVNMSFEGEGVNRDEYSLLSTIHGYGKALLAASGNTSVSLSDTCTVYPACYPFVRAVGCYGDAACKSNWGIKNQLNGPACVDRFCGSSASTAWMSAEMVKIIVAFTMWREA